VPEFNELLPEIPGNTLKLHHKVNNMPETSSRKKKNQIQKLLKQKRKDLWHDLLPLIKAFALWIILVIAVAIDYTYQRWFSMIFIDLTTYLTYGLAKIMFIQAEILGNGLTMVTTLEIYYKSILISNYSLMIELECSAYHAYLAMISLVIFSAWTNKQKLWIGSLLFGILALVNSLRIILLGLLGKHYPEIFNLMHDYIWNILLVIMLWGLWELANQRIRKVESAASNLTKTQEKSIV
jgi:exosortase/archaeosortase family protein